MRKFAIALLLAGAATATPAIAAPRDWSDHHQQQSNDNSSSHQDRQASHEDRSARQESHNDRSNNDRPQFNRGGPPPQVGGQQQFTSGGGDHDNGRRVQGNFGGGDNGARFQGNISNGSGDNGRRVHGSFGSRGDGSANYVAPGPREVTVPNADGRQVRQDGFRDRGLRQADRSYPQVMRDRHPLVVSNTPRFGTQPPLRVDSRHRDVRWSTNWRNDHRYDWRDRRRHHHSLFHLGLFIDPFGWDYQPFSIGYRLWPAYYGNQYWIDPSLYGLPYPPPGCVWIRYWNDAILVDTYSGTTLDVIPNFFW